VKRLRLLVAVGAGRPRRRRIVGRVHGERALGAKVDGRDEISRRPSKGCRVGLSHLTVAHLPPRPGAAEDQNSSGTTGSEASISGGQRRACQKRAGQESELRCGTGGHCWGTRSAERGLEMGMDLARSCPGGQGWPSPIPLMSRSTQGGSRSRCTRAQGLGLADVRGKWLLSRSAARARRRVRGEGVLLAWECSASEI
jgi:hypothetical protein